MTRAQGLRSSKRKLLKSSQEDTILEYCKENSPSILSQNSRRVAQAKTKSHDCKENILKGSNKKLLKISQDVVPEYCKENSPSNLSQNSRRVAQVKTKSHDCKENNLKGSNKKPLKISQDVPEYCKENSPYNLSQRSRRVTQIKKNFDSCIENILPKVSKKKPVKLIEGVIPELSKENSSPTSIQSSRRLVPAKKKSDNCKENISPEGLYGSSKRSPVSKNQEVFSPLRKSRRHPNATEQIKANNILSERSVLCDTTNSLQAGLRRNNVFHNIIAVLQPATSTINDNTCHETHIPVYKGVSPLKPVKNMEPVTEKAEGVYEFEIDESEEPVQKKKRKKRAYTRKPKIGPKALTINNIKYSSTESLASLPENPVCKKKNTFVRPKCNIKPCSSVATLNGSSVSVQSFRSQPTLPLRENRFELSVLQETQSEQSTALESTLMEAPVAQSFSSSSAVPATLSQSHHSHFSPNPRCYGSKSNQTPNPYNDDQNAGNDYLSQQASSSANNVSTSSHDFLSSTPCKRFSLVVRDNSVFDNSPGMRHSLGLTQDASSLMAIDGNCFGFDEPEELEEPLVSPIKYGIDYQPRRVLKCAPKKPDWEEPKPSIQEVIELLKANIPKPAAKKDTTMFVTSPQSNTSASPTVLENDSPVFLKPARRSYERQRRVRYYDSESEEEEETVEEIKDDATNVKENKKCYKKANTTKTEKAPRVTKAQQRIAKEEEELERMAALMNAQFQEIDKVDLVVE